MSPRWKKLLICLTVGLWLLALLAALWWFQGRYLRPFDERTAVFGEVGLAGEVRATSQASVRVREAYAMGFKRCVIPHGNLTGLDYDDGIEVVGARNVADALDALF